MTGDENQDVVSSPAAAAAVAVAEDGAAAPGSLKSHKWRRPHPFVVGFVTCAVVAVAIGGFAAAREPDENQSAKVERAQELLKVDAVPWIEARLDGAPTTGDTIRVGRFSVEALSIEKSELDGPLGSQNYRITNATDVPVLSWDLGNFCVSSRGNGFTTPSSWMPDVQETDWLAPGASADLASCGLGLPVNEDSGMDKEIGLAGFYDVADVRDQFAVAAFGNQTGLPFPPNLPFYAIHGGSAEGPLHDGNVRQVGKLSDSPSATLAWERQSATYWFSDVLDPGRVVLTKLAPDVEPYSGEVPPNDGVCSSRWVAALDFPGTRLLAPRNIVFDRSGPKECMAGSSLVIGETPAYYFKVPNVEDI